MTSPRRWLRGVAAPALKRVGLWEAYNRARARRVLARDLPATADRAAHRRMVAEAQERERALLVEAAAPNAVPLELLAEFFSSFQVVDAGIPLVRVGPDADGGYLLPDDLDGIAACYSPGVAGEIGFDLALAERGIAVRMVDASVAGLPQEHPLIDFEPLFVGASTGGQWTTLGDWVARRSAPDDELMLEMDIEGHEWGVLLGLPEGLLRRFRILVLELHDLHHLAVPSGYASIAAGFERLLRDFHLLHVHPNNYVYPVAYRGYRLHPVVEVTLLRKDRAASVRQRTSLTHPLDRPNTDLLADYPLDDVWL